MALLAQWHATQVTCRSISIQLILTQFNSIKMS
nr:MAG TPA: hypothetical protein [Caudoviricetes sp.]